MNVLLGGVQQLRGQDEVVGGQKMSVFVHAQGIKTVHVVVECPFIQKKVRRNYPLLATLFLDDGTQV